MPAREGLREGPAWWGPSTPAGWWAHHVSWVHVPFHYTGERAMPYHRVITGSSFLNRGKYQSVSFPCGDRSVVSGMGSRYTISSQEHQVGPRTGPSEATVVGSMKLTPSGCLLVNRQPRQQLQTARFAGEERGPERLGSPSSEQWGCDQSQGASPPGLLVAALRAFDVSGLRTGSHVSGPQDTVSAAAPRT